MGAAGPGGLPDAFRVFLAVAPKIW